MFVWLSESLDKAESTWATYSTVLLALIFAVILVFIAGGSLNLTAVLVTILITGLLFLLATSTYGDDVGGSLPSTTYPLPPHLGLGGNKLQIWYPNAVPGNDPQG